MTRGELACVAVDLSTAGVADLRSPGKAWLSLNAVASAPADPEPAYQVEVCRDLQPYRYRAARE